ncbi:MAG: dihydrofolate reductase [Leptolyngbyaceae bacterium]|nr:dihydrofolate reductase [Leptolyngbyaceae bacterium]
MTNCGTEIVLIAALCRANRVIGHHGTLPWHLPEDLKRFRELTTEHAVIMGRKTWEYGLKGRSLPHRHNIIVSRTLSAQSLPAESDIRTSCCIVSSLQDAFRHSANEEKVFVIGGASLYAQTLEMADRLELTLVDGVYEGDTFFPEYESIVQESFHLIHESTHESFQTQTYVRT